MNDMLVFISPFFGIIDWDAHTDCCFGASGHLFYRSDPQSS